MLYRRFESILINFLNCFILKLILKACAGFFDGFGQGGKLTSCTLG